MNNKKKLFIFSDTHSYYDEFIKALTEAGYDENNPDHWLIGLGDYFDRGPKAQEMYEFLMTHTERTVLVKGNHDDLIQELFDRGYANGHDFTNGTVDTVGQLAGEHWEQTGFGVKTDRNSFNKASMISSAKLYPLYERMVNYFETKNYVFVHGFIPTTYEKVNIESKNFLINTLHMKEIYQKDWRECQEWEWAEARWANGMKRIFNGIYVPGKKVVMGHWHCSWGYYVDMCIKAQDEDTDYPSQSEYEYGDKANFTPYYHKHGIAIDACTALSNKCNILVLEDEFLED